MGKKGSNYATRYSLYGITKNAAARRKSMNKILDTEGEGGRTKKGRTDFHPLEEMKQGDDDLGLKNLRKVIPVPRSAIFHWGKVSRERRREGRDK